MSTLAQFLAHLFDTGEAKLTDRPEPDDGREVQALLRDAFHEYGLDVGGPPIDFAPEAAAAAALLMARACWFAVSRQESPEEVAAILQLPAEPSTAAGHLSIDLTLRYAVTVHRRVYAQNPEDVLAFRLAAALRRCPLTGVLADLADSPTGDLTFAAHPG